MFPGHSEHVSKDKFLILSALVPEKEKMPDLNTMWKQIPKSSIMEHRYEIINLNEFLHGAVFCFDDISLEGGPLHCSGLALVQRDAACPKLGF